MRIRVSGRSSGLTEQMRAYAEYQVFLRLAPMARRIGAVDILVTRPEDAAAVCAATADLGDAGCVRARVERPEPVDAINGAALVLADAAWQRLRTGTLP